MIKVLERVNKRHPDMIELEVVGAWESRIRTQYRLDGNKPYMVAVGVSSSGKLIQMIAFDDGGDMVIFHAMKATNKVLIELGML